MARSIYSILIVDDDVEIVDSMARDIELLARKFGDEWVIYKGLSALDVLTILPKHSMDVLVLDYHFKGGMNGDEIIDKLDDALQSMMIIMMSDRKQQELEDVVVKRHINHGLRFKFLRKPYDNLELQSMYWEMKKYLLNRPYPFPLAHSLSMLDTSTTAQGKMTVLKDLIEIVTKYSISIALAVLVFDYKQTEYNSRKIYFNKTTFGVWLQCLQGLQKYLANDVDCQIGRELRKALTEENCAVISSFKNKVRDQVIGHGVAKDEKYYDNVVREYEASIRKILQDYRFISRYIFFVVEKMDFAQDSDEYTYTVRTLMGNDANFELITVRSTTRLKRGEVYVYLPTGQYISLHPMVTYELCRECSIPRVYVLDAFNKECFCYNSSCNHKLDTQKKYPEVLIKLRLLWDMGYLSRKEKDA